MTPDDRKYTKTHEWVKVDGALVAVGLTDHAQEQLGDITFVELPEVGKKLEQEAECCVIESVKAASDVFAPVAGEVAEVNSALEATPGLVNESPYGQGWIYKLKAFDTAQLDALMSAEQYEAGLG